VATYKNAPLKYVVFGVEISPSAVLGEREVLDQIHEALRAEVPVREDSTSELVPPGLAGLVRASGARFVDGDQHLAVAVTPNRVAVDTTDYSDFDQFFAFLTRVLDAVAAVAPGRACRRLGLRYVDEIRIPGAVPGDVEQWSGWLDESLFAASTARPTTGRREISGVLDDSLEDGYGIRFAWHTGTGYAVQPQGPLMVPDPADPGPYFALDTDSYWSANEVLGLGDPSLIQRVAKLHEPIKDLFETCITDKLRNEVLLPQEES
jgi:uncharacterized protein (TIGR04255 family)